jgi:putative endonuclease
MLASKRNGTLYLGVTNNVARRCFEHREGQGSEFTKKYGVKRLVYIECFDDVRVAIRREKQFKTWNRKWKLELIERANPQWLDLYGTLNGGSALSGGRALAPGFPLPRE